MSLAGAFFCKLFCTIFLGNSSLYFMLILVCWSNSEENKVFILYYTIRVYILLFDSLGVIEHLHQNLSTEQIIFMFPTASHEKHDRVW